MRSRAAGYAALSLLLLAPAGGAETLFTDDFNDGNANGWFAMPTGASYTVENYWYRFEATSSSDSTVAVSVNGDDGWSMSVPDYSVRVRCWSDNGNMGIFIRFNWIYQRGYLCLASPGEDKAAIMRIDDATGAVILDEVPVTLHNDREYWLRFEVYEDIFGMKVWEGGTGDEPDEWTVTVTDDTYAENGCFGLYGHDDPGSPSHTYVRFDDVTVTDDNSVGLDGGSWGSIKASF